MERCFLVGVGCKRLGMILIFLNIPSFLLETFSGSRGDIWRHSLQVQGTSIMPTKRVAKSIFSSKITTMRVRIHSKNLNKQCFNAKSFLRVISTFTGSTVNKSATGMSKPTLEDTNSSNIFAQIWAMVLVSFWKNFKLMFISWMGENFSAKNSESCEAIKTHQIERIGIFWNDFIEIKSHFKHFWGKIKDVKKKWNLSFFPKLTLENYKK